MRVRNGDPEAKCFGGGEKANFQKPKKETRACFSNARNTKQRVAQRTSRARDDGVDRDLSHFVR